MGCMPFCVEVIYINILFFQSYTYTCRVVQYNYVTMNTTKLDGKLFFPERREKEASVGQDRKKEIPNPALAVCEALIRFSEWCARQMHQVSYGHTRKKKERSLSFPCERSVSCACPGGKRFKMQLAFAKGKKNQPVEANLHEREEKERQKTGTGRSVCRQDCRVESRVYISE